MPSSNLTTHSDHGLGPRPPRPMSIAVGMINPKAVPAGGLVEANHRVLRRNRPVALVLWRGWKLVRVRIITPGGLLRAVGVGPGEYGILALTDAALGVGDTLVVTARSLWRRSHIFRAMVIARIGETGPTP